MHRIGLLAGVGILLGACSLIPGLTTPQGCPAALLEGRLVPDGGGGAAVETEFGATAVEWPDGYRVEEADGLVLRDEHGKVVAAEGDTIYVGGGMNAADDRFIACGYVSSDPP